MSVAPGRVAPLAVLLALVVLVPTALVLTAPEAKAATTKVLTITAATAKPTVPFATFDAPSPKVFDFDGDGDKEIVAQNDNQWVYVFDSRTGALLAELKTVFPSGWGARTMNPPEVAIMTGDGKAHLIVANSAATITSYTFDKTASTAGKFVFQKDWQRRLTDCHSNPGMDSKPVLADLDKDGRLEILAATEESGVYALHDTGAVMWKTCIGGGNAEPTVGDLNLDSWPDVVFGSDGGVVTAMNGRTGGTMWAFDARTRYDLGSGSMPVGVAIGQLDGLTGPDVVVGARDSHDATDFTKNHALLLALSAGGSVLWARQDGNGGAPLTYTHPIIVDAAKDGQPEVYWADWNTVGHNPGDWRPTGPAHFYRYDKAGTLVWKQSLNTFWNNKDIPLADVDGDGVQEMLANGPGDNGHDGIWYLDSRTGAKETWIDLYPYKLNRAPYITDLYGNGRMQWIAEVAPLGNGIGAHGLVVYDTGSAYSSAWPHLPDPPRGTGTGPVSTTTTTTSNPGTFDATFTGVTGNQWWVQANVATNGPAVTKVDVRLANNGAWGGFMSVTKQSWGWGSSYHIPQGTIVQLRATASDGRIDLSSCRQWIPPSGADAAIVPCPGESGGGGTTFTAAFTPKAVGNDWWVEADVSGNQPIAKVEAKVNSGAWTTLTKQSWGSWAKSMNAPNGSQVTFRATSSTGAVVTSSPYAWP